MTNEEINDQVGKIVEPDICRHKFGDYHTLDGFAGASQVKCNRCPQLIDKKDLMIDDDILCLNASSFNYLSPDGIAKVRDWLDEKNLWDAFVGHKSGLPSHRTLETERRVARVYVTPKLFIDKFLTFIEYAKEKGLGE